MSSAMVVHQQASIAAVQQGWESKTDLIKRTVAKGATNDELEIFLHQCRKTGLDPLAKQIYFQKRKTKNGDQMTIITGIDGYRLVADRTKQYAGNDDPVFDDDEKPTKATVTVYKLIDGVRCAFTASARWSQYYPGDYLGFMWNKMPHLMLGKCAEALALRKAFPAELSGVYTAEEMHQAGEPEKFEQLEAEDKKLDCIDCGKEIDGVEIKGVFYPLEKVKAANKKDFPEVNLCALCQIQRHRLAREMSAEPAQTPEAAPVQHTDIEAAADESDAAINDETGRAVGMVKKVWPKNGKKPYAISLQICGDVLHFSTFSETEGKKMAGSEGQRVVLSFVKDGKYRNIKEIEKVGTQDFVVEGEPF
jgi:phage recombination protein Bet